ncbi:MAG: DinB family protein [Bacteroidota bacterium]
MIAARLGALDAHRLAFTDRLDGLPSEIVHTAPAPGAWSLAQLAEHLFIIDRGLVLGGPEAGALGTVRSRLGATALRGILSLPVRIPAPPSAQGVMPSASPRWPDVRDAWAALRADWHRALPEADPTSVTYRHPIAGPLRLDDALAFLLAHHRHHDAQVRRTLAALGRPRLGVAA